MINRVKLILNEKIDMLDNFNKHVTKEKEIIISEIKNYLKDCILELKVFNKLGRFNESKLFSIDLPDEEKLNYLVVDEIVENLSINKNLDEVNSVINSFYLLNKLINISNLKIKVIKFELNNKKSFINWNDISKYTSGGQQFCVSFIILVILMEYKRYDPKKLSNKPVSKVLIMDNPFGKTSEEEFLNLVFKLADKFKVQIISYTHITNASVRNQFNKIYKMTVELTTNNREIVMFEESKNNSIKENVEMNNYFIEKENTKDINFFEIIK